MAEISQRKKKKNLGTDFVKNKMYPKTFEMTYEEECQKILSLAHAKNHHKKLKPSQNNFLPTPQPLTSSRVMVPVCRLSNSSFSAARTYPL